MEAPNQDVSKFDLRKPHLRNTGVKGEVTIVQNGFIYAFSLPNPKMDPYTGGRVIGKIADMKPLIVAQGHKFCDFCGFSFGQAEGLEQHLYEAHRDVLLVSLVQHKPDELKLGELPTDEQLRTEATRMVSAEEAKEIQAKQDAVPEVKEHNENKKHKKGAYREPVRP